jgi:hypothetical protein
MSCRVSAPHENRWVVGDGVRELDPMIGSSATMTAAWQTGDDDSPYRGAEAVSEPAR